MAILKKRETPTNLSHEPDYPGLETVLFCISAPDMTAHPRHKDCEIECPHLISECGMFDKQVDPEIMKAMNSHEFGAKKSKKKRF